LKKTKKLFWLPASLVLAFLCILIFLNLSSDWNGDRRFTVVMQNIYPEGSETENELGIISLEASSGRGIYFYINPDIMLDLPYGFKTYPSSSVYRLGELENNRGGGHLLERSVELSLGVKTDGYIVAKNKQFFLAREKKDFSVFKKDNFSLIRGLPFLYRLMIGNLESDLSPTEKFRFWNAVRNIRLDQLEFVNLAHTTSVYREKLPDKSEVYRIDAVNFDHNHFGSFEDRGIRFEEISVEVQNASGEEKVATLFARVLKNFGVKVIARSTANVLINRECTVISANHKAKTSRLVEIMATDYNCIPEFSDNENAQADLMVILGRNFIK